MRRNVKRRSKSIGVERLVSSAELLGERGDRRLAHRGAHLPFAGREGDGVQHRCVLQPSNVSARRRRSRAASESGASRCGSARRTRTPKHLPPRSERPERSNVCSGWCSIPARHRVCVGGLPGGYAGSCSASSPTDRGGPVERQREVGGIRGAQRDGHPRGRAANSKFLDRATGQQQLRRDIRPPDDRGRASDAPSSTSSSARLHGGLRPGRSVIPADKSVMSHDRGHDPVPRATSSVRRHRCGPRRPRRRSACGGKHNDLVDDIGRTNCHFSSLRDVRQLQLRRLLLLEGSSSRRSSTGTCCS